MNGLLPLLMPMPIRVTLLVQKCFQLVERRQNRMKKGKCIHSIRCLIDSSVRMCNKCQTAFNVWRKINDFESTEVERYERDRVSGTDREYANYFIAINITVGIVTLTSAGEKKSIENWIKFKFKMKEAPLLPMPHQSSENASCAVTYTRGIFVRNTLAAHVPALSDWACTTTSISVTLFINVRRFQETEHFERWKRANTEKSKTNEMARNSSVWHHIRKIIISVSLIIIILIKIGE